MPDKLSSSYTFMFKIIFPVTWIIGFGTGTFFIWFGKFDQHSHPPEYVKFIFLMGFVIGSAFLLRDMVRLKTVAVEGNVLIVKNFIKAIKIPLRNIRSISESRLTRPKLIYLQINPQTAFGEKIIFIPKAKFKLTLNPISEHPIVTRLRELLGSQL
jgi:hypothetical protein